MTPSTETKRDARRERRRRAPTAAAIRHGNEFKPKPWRTTNERTARRVSRLDSRFMTTTTGSVPLPTACTRAVASSKSSARTRGRRPARAPWSTTPRFKPRSRYSTSNFATSSNTNRPVEAKVAPAIPTARSTSWKPCPETANGSPARSTSFARSPSPSHHRDPARTARTTTTSTIFSNLSSSPIDSIAHRTRALSLSRSRPRRRRRRDFKFSKSKRLVLVRHPPPTTHLGARRPTARTTRWIGRV